MPKLMRTISTYLVIIELCKRVKLISRVGKLEVPKHVPILGSAKRADHTFFF